MQRHRHYLLGTQFTGWLIVILSLLTSCQPGQQLTNLRFLEPEQPVATSADPGQTSMPTCTAPTPLTATVAQQSTASATTMSAALTALAGSSRALFDVQALPVEASEEVGLPMVIGTWGESVSFRSGGFFVWHTPDERWSMHTFCLDDEKLVTARIQQNGEQRELAVIWDPCVTSSMGHCQQVQLYRYDGPQWALRW